MNFNEHYDLEGRHAFLGASNYHWVNYDDEKLESVFLKHSAAQQGTRLHAWASETIRLGIKQARSKNTLNLYVNDAIGFRMSVEQPLRYSENCFGTADAISFRKDVLRIFDYKSGVTSASFWQLIIYAALFCLEYQHDPYKISIELRIYQNNEVLVKEPTPEEVAFVCDKIVSFDKRIELLKIGV